MKQVGSYEETRYNCDIDYHCVIFRLEIKINKMIMKKDWTVKELVKELTENYNDNDVIVIESTDPKTGDTQDLHGFYIDEIDGLIMGDGTVVSELRLTMVHE